MLKNCLFRVVYICVSYIYILLSCFVQLVFHPMDCSPPCSSVHGTFQAEYWSKLPFLTGGDLPDPKTEAASPASPALAVGFFTSVPLWKP